MPNETCSVLVQEEQKMLETSILREAYKQSKTIDRQQTVIFVGLLVLDKLVLPLASSMLLTAYTGGASMCIIAVLICNFVCNLMQFPIHKITACYTTKLVETFVIDSTTIYTRIDTISEKKHPKDEFWQLNEKAKFALSTLFDWGIQSLFGTIGQMISVLYVFIKSGMIAHLVVCVVAYFAIYMCILRKEHIKFAKNDENFRNEDHKANEYLRLKQQFVSHRDYIAQHIPKLANNTDKIFTNRMLLNFKTNSFGSVINDGVCNFTIFFVSTNFWSWLLFGTYFIIAPTKDVLLYYFTIHGLSGSITSLAHFGNRFTRIANDYDAFVKFLSECTYQPKPIDIAFPEVFKTTSINIKKGGFVLEMDPKSKPFSFKKGDFILVQGKTGDGKTTFIEGIMGKVAGVTLDKNFPENHYHAFSDFDQNAVKKLRWSKITLRQLFGDEKDDECIDKYLALTMPELDDIKKRLCKDNFNAYDVPLECMFSGGQEVRCFLALKVYEAFRNGDEVVSFDEPEQGTDPEVIIHVITNILSILKKHHKTVIMVSHICQCRIEELKKKGFEFNVKVNIRNNLIFFS